MIARIICYEVDVEGEGPGSWADHGGIGGRYLPIRRGSLLSDLEVSPQLQGF
jgi:hypothetical protein